MTTSVALPVTAERLFEFFSDARQLEQLTPPWLHFEILTPQPIRICRGSLIDYRIRLHQIPIRWRTEISEWNPPFSFVDRQIRGPYLLWEHTHRFAEQDGVTVVTDEVRYRVPGGRLVHWLFVKADLLRIFTYRQQRMQALFGHQPAAVPA